MPERSQTPDYGGLIPCRIAALGPARQPEPRLLGLQNAVYRLIVRIGEAGAARAPEHPPRPAEPAAIPADV